MNVVLFRSLPKKDNVSMGVYADNLESYLNSESPGGTDRWVRAFGFPPSQTRPDLLHYLERYLVYPVRALLSQGDINHVVDHSYGYLVFFLDRKKTVVTFHDAVLFKSRVPVKAHQRWIQRLCLEGIKRAARVIVVSETSRKDLLEIAPGLPASKIRVIHMGIEDGFGSVCEETRQVLQDRYRIPKNRRRILHVGHNGFYKNIETLLKVLDLLGEDYDLLKIGPPFSESQRRMIRDLGLAHRIYALSNVPRSDLPGLYELGSVLVFPSWYEGFGLPPLEAMACGVPVIVSNAGALSEIIGNGVLSFEPDDAAGMAQAVQRIYQDESLRVSLRKAGFELADKFRWINAVQMTRAVYQEVLSEASARR